MAHREAPGDVAPLDVVVVARDLDRAELEREGQARKQAAGEDRRAAHDGKHHRELVAERRGDLARHALDLALDLLGRAQQVGLPQEAHGLVPALHAFFPARPSEPRKALNSPASSGCLSA